MRIDVFEDVYFQRNLVCFPITGSLGLLGVKVLYASVMTEPAGIYTKLTNFTFQDAIMDFVKEIFLF